MAISNKFISRGEMLALFLLSLIITACADVRLTPKEDPPLNVSSKGNFCLQDPTTIAASTKFLFIIDKSGSNASGIGGGTDPGATKRATNVEKFIQENMNEDNYQWNIIQFADYKVFPYITEKDGITPRFTSDGEEALAAANRLRETDGGGTPYREPLNVAKSAIRADIEKYPDEESMYMLFFISDGAPTPNVPDRELEELVGDMVHGMKRTVHLSTAYYGHNGPRAIEKLKKMAKAGGGEFINFEESDDWDFDKLVVKTKVEPWTLKSLLVYNVSAGYCIDGKIDVDSDGDGMCDRDEIAASKKYKRWLKGKKFDPQKRFSFGDGYSDYFHWRRFRWPADKETGEPSDLPKCDKKTRKDYRDDADFDLLTTCEEEYIYNRDPQPGFPNRGNAKNPDTDRDGILDGIETFVYFQKSLAHAMDPENLQHSRYDGEEDAGEQIAQHRSPIEPDAESTAYDTDYQSKGDDCFSFKQTVLPLYKTLEVKEKDTLPGLGHKAGENIVYLYYIQTPQSDPDGNGVLKYSFQKLEHDPNNPVFLGDKAGLQVDDSVFGTYVVPDLK